MSKAAPADVVTPLDEETVSDSAVMADPLVKISVVVKLVVSCKNEPGIVEGHVVAAVVRTEVASVWGGIAVVGSGVVMTVVGNSVVVAT